MAGIKDYSPVPASNTALFPEGMAPSAVNDGMRQVQADIRTEVASKGADIASAETVDLGAATGDFVDITGTTTIASFGTISAGIRRTVRFRGALTLTHHATSLILPGRANITTADGDIARFRSLGSGSWVCEGYSRANGLAVDDSNYAKLDTANIFTADQMLKSTDAGTTGPSLNLYHNSVSPAADDAVASLDLKGNDSAGNETTYARIRSRIVNPTDGAEGRPGRPGRDNGRRSDVGSELGSRHLDAERDRRRPWCGQDQRRRVSNKRDGAPVPEGL